MEHPVHYICIPTLGNGEHGWEVRFTSPFFLSLAIPRIKGPSLCNAWKLVLTLIGMNYESKENAHL